MERRAPSASKTAVAKLQITIGCAGFPVPATRYFKEFFFVEVQDTHVALPGMGTIRRWRREAPKGFKFSMLAPRELADAGFKVGKSSEALLKGFVDMGKELDSSVVIFVAPPELTGSRVNKAGVKEFLKFVRKKFEKVVWDAPHWKPSDAAEAANEAGAIAARDPLTSGLSDQPLAYYRLPGPAGHKSRYEDPAIERLAELARKAKHTDATYVFANVDMFADAKRFMKALKL